MKNKLFVIAVATLLVLLCCSKGKVNIEENIKELVINQVRFNNRYKWLDVEGLSVRPINKYDSLLTGKLFEISTISQPSYYFYAIQKADSILLLKGDGYYKKPEETRDIVAFLNYQSLRTEKDIYNFIEIYLKVITSNCSDSLINSIQQINGLNLLEDENGKYVKFNERAKIYVDPSFIRPLSINRSYILERKKLDIFFNTINYYSGYLYFIKISIDNEGNYSSERIRLLKILPGQLIM